MRVLLLGGTAEARQLATRLHPTPGVEVVSSLAGRVTSPRLPPGVVRVGGFGGADALAAFVLHERIDAVVDATHPFATRITAHAARAAERARVPLLVLRRPGWTEQAGDRWLRVPDLEAAAHALGERPPGVVLLAVGRGGVTRFAADPRHVYVVRVVEPPAADVPLPPRHCVIVARGPFTVDGELELLTGHRVDVVVGRDGGGPAAEAKLHAARRLDLPVVLVDRPALPGGLRVVRTVDEAADWLARPAR